MPFRETHHISGAAVKLAEDRGCQLSELTVQDLQGINPLFGEDVTQASCLLMPWIKPHDSTQWYGCVLRELQALLVCVHAGSLSG